MQSTELEQEVNQDVLIVILARSQSKRIPNKNMRELGGKPLIEWTIDCAKEIVAGNRILVSTDGIEIRNIALQNGVLAPWLRPRELSLDSTPSADSLKHAVDWFSKNVITPRVVVLLQPTSPFRTATTIKEALKLHRNRTNSTVVAVSKRRMEIENLYKIEDGALVSITPGWLEKSIPQNGIFEINGAIYVVNSEFLLNQGVLYTESVVAIEIESRIESIDIDTEMDWQLAQVVADNFKFKANKGNL